MRLNSLRRRAWLTAVLATLVVLTLLVWRLPDVFKAPREESSLALSKGRAIELARALDEYYSHTLDGATTKDDFLRRLSGLDYHFLVPPAEDAERTLLKVAFYLLLPPRSGCEGVVLTGYSEPIRSQKRAYRVLLFRRTSETAVVVIEEHEAQQMLGQYASQTTYPDLYLYSGVRNAQHKPGE